MKKIVVDADRCLRCGACVAVAKENFDYGEDGESVVINQDINDEVLNAVDMCPVSAIQIVEEDNTEEEIKEAA